MLVLTETSSVYNPPSHGFITHVLREKLRRVGLYTELLYAIIPYLVSVCFAVLIYTLQHFYCFYFHSLYIVSMYPYIQSLPNYVQAFSLPWACE